MANKVDAFASWIIQPPHIVGKLTDAWNKGLGREPVNAAVESVRWVESDRWFMQYRGDAFPQTLAFVPRVDKANVENPGATPNAQYKSGTVYLQALGIAGV